MVLILYSEKFMMQKDKKKKRIDFIETNFDQMLSIFDSFLEQMLSIFFFSYKNDRFLKNKIK